MDVEVASHRSFSFSACGSGSYIVTRRSGPEALAGKTGLFFEPHPGFGMGDSLIRTEPRGLLRWDLLLKKRVRLKVSWLTVENMSQADRQRRRANDQNVVEVTMFKQYARIFRYVHNPGGAASFGRFWIFGREPAT